MDSSRRTSPGRLRRLREELEEEGTGIVASASDPDVLVDELDYALHPPRHERRRPTYGSLVLPTADVAGWDRVTGLHTALSHTAHRDDQDVRKYADGRVSWTVRDRDGVSALAVFDRAAGSERDIVVLAEATNGIVVQRRADGGVRVAGPFGVARWDTTDWHVEPPFESWLQRASCGLDDDGGLVLDRLLRFAVHDLGAAGIGALFVLGGRQESGFEQRLAPPPELHVDRPTDLGPLRHVLSQIDGAALVDRSGVLRHLGVRLVPTADAERSIAAIGGTRHTSARRYSHDDPTAIVVAVSESGPVTVFRGGRVVGRSDPVG